MTGTEFEVLGSIPERERDFCLHQNVQTDLAPLSLFTTEYWGKLTGTCSLTLISVQHWGLECLELYLHSLLRVAWSDILFKLLKARVITSNTTWIATSSCFLDMYVHSGEREMLKGVAERKEGGVGSNLVTSVSLETLPGTLPLFHHRANYTPCTLLPPKVLTRCRVALRFVTHAQ
jgi:hypothetical protein